MSEKRNNKSSEYEGSFIGNPKGFGFVRCEDLDEDIFIPEENVKDAMHGDTVLVRTSPFAGGRRVEGEIRKILQRGTEEAVGTFRKSKNFGFVVPDNRKFTKDLFIEKGNDGGASDGDKVVVKILDYGSKKSKPSGRITEILGNENDPGTDILSIARGADIPMEFPEKVLKQADRISDQLLPGDFAGREDLRKWKTVTIDGPDAKDLDDAVSLTKDGKNYILGVHIADVSNYVQDHSALDREALKRGTSVYLADRVIPMLPKKLSNGICSLNAGEDRLTLSCIMTLDEKGRITDHRICETVIRVGRRMSYPDVKAILEDRNPALLKEYKGYITMFRQMLELSKKIRALRTARGAIDFDFPEAEILLNEEGVPTDIQVHEANCATKLIEDFMLSANETVAEEFAEKKIPFVYRVHEDPDPDKIEELIAFVRKQGIIIDKKKQSIAPMELQQALKKIEGTPEEGLISRVILRSMQQARYSTECTGHFGLAAKYYCHFTSPIRRYPDLQIHRIIKDFLRGRMNETRKAYYKEILDDVALKSSTAERRADDVERDTEKLKKAQFMQSRVGEEYDGVISGVTGWGFYVELPNTVEGLVHMQNLRDDYYEYDEENRRVVGRLSGRTYSLGDPVKIRVIGAEPAAGTIDFEPADTPFHGTEQKGSSLKRTAGKPREDDRLPDFLKKKTADHRKNRKKEGHTLKKNGHSGRQHKRR
jgi:ribonuclease R